MKVPSSLYKKGKTMTFITSQRRPWRFVALLGLLFVALAVMLAPTAQATPVLGTISASCKQTVLRLGADGTCVKQLQTALIEKGFSVGPSGADSSFGNNTEAGVLAYQKANKLDVDGVVGPQTWGHLTKSAIAVPPPSKSSCSKQVMRLGSQGDCVVEFQKLLDARGEWLGQSGVDGSFGYDMLRSLKHYQKISGLEPDGLGGPLTWGHLLSGDIKLDHLDARCFNAGTVICTDKSDQKTYVFKDGQLVRAMASRVGGWFEFKGEWLKKSTPNGSFTILNRVIDETSAIYDETPMKYSQYFTNQGHAFHQSDSFTEFGNYQNEKGQAGSGGCVNLQPHDAKWLWNNAGYGTKVVIQP